MAVELRRAVLFRITLSYGLAPFPETLRQRLPEPVSPISILRSYRLFLRTELRCASRLFDLRAFLGLFAWISTAAFVLQDIYGLTPLTFGLAFAIALVGLFARRRNRRAL